jgi:hypothetical protein
VYIAEVERQKQYGVSVTEYVCETWAIKVDDIRRQERTDMVMGSGDVHRFCRSADQIRSGFVLGFSVFMLLTL